VFIARKDGHKKAPKAQRKKSMRGQSPVIPGLFVGLPLVGRPLFP
jgi:hypothetical protein